ncbi:MAG: kynureninase, partial [Bacteroidota bacterium]|nr:kynureninase [Bacteroidota bacterium]
MIFYKMNFENTLEYARELDEKDSLKDFRNRFLIPKREGREQIYFLGNSLGLQPKSTLQYIQTVLAEWEHYGMQGFFMGDAPWYHYHDSLTKLLSKIVGALPHEVVVMNQLTVNLHLMMVSFYKPSGKRNKIICEAKAFPSDQYMMESFVKHYSLNPDEIIIEISPRSEEHLIRHEDILTAIEKNKNELALVLWGGINYYSGQLFDIKSITAAAHAVGATAGIDLAHATGNVPLQLHDWDVDFACWCSYKYLNSGPGAIGGCFIHERFHQDESLQRLAGWWGYDKVTRFKMDKGFKPIHSAEGWQLSTPSILLYVSHKASLDIFEEAGMELLIEKGRLLNNYTMFIIDEINSSTNKKLIEVLT